MQVSEIEIVYNNPIPAAARPRITKSLDAVDIFRPLFKGIQHREQMHMILLNRTAMVLGSYLLSIGGISETLLDARVVFQVALKANATSFILCHNHPSGSIQPSDADNKLTTKIKEVGNFLNIKLVDHLIITEEEYYSYADNGLI